MLKIDSRNPYQSNYNNIKIRSSDSNDAIQEVVETALGCGVDFKSKENQILAYKNIKVLAKQGKASAQNRLGKCYFYGINCAMKLNKAIKYYELSASQGNSRGQDNLGVFYINMNNVQEAFKNFQLSAEQGNCEAQNNLGAFYQNGNGCDINLDKALKYYQLSAKQGDPDGQMNLEALLKWLQKGLNKS